MTMTMAPPAAVPNDWVVCLGEARPVTVKEIKDATVVLDFNHPLAGADLSIEVSILGVL